MIKVFRKGSTVKSFKEVSDDPVNLYMNDENLFRSVCLSFTTGSGSQYSDFKIEIHNEELERMIELCAKALFNRTRALRSIDDYSADELMEALKSKIKSE